MPQAEDQQEQTPVEKKRSRVGRPPKYETVEELERVINEYFDECDPHWIDEEYWDYPLVEVVSGKGSDRKAIKIRDKNAEMTLQTRKVKTEQQPYTMSGLAYRLGLSRQALMEYRKERGDAFGDTIKNARQLVEQYNERLLLTGKNATGAIFNLKVNFAFKENEEENKPPENPITFINLVPQPPDEMPDPDPDPTPPIQDEVPADEQ